MDFPFDPSKLNLGNLMGMARQFQERMERIQEEMARVTVEATVGGGMVTVIANGRQEILEVRISPELFQMKDQAMIQDLVAAAVNEALIRSKQRMQEEVSKLTGGIPLPPNLLP